MATESQALTDPHDNTEEESEEKVLPSESQGVQNRKFKCYSSVDEEEYQLTFSYNTGLSKKNTLERGVSCSFLKPAWCTISQ